MFIGERLDGQFEVTRTLESGRYRHVYWGRDREGLPCLVRRFIPCSLDWHTLDLARQLFHRETQKLLALAQQCDRAPAYITAFERERNFYLIERPQRTLSLQERLNAEQCLPEADVVRILSDLLEVLEIAHGLDLMHGNINPTTIVQREADGRWGLRNFAAIENVSAPLADIVALPPVGTPSYMPLEQAQGHLTPDCDLYALGLTAMQMLSGLHPSELSLNGGGTLEGVHWLAQATPSERLVRVLNKATLAVRADRYTVAREMREDVGTCLSPALDSATAPILPTNAGANLRAQAITVGAGFAAAIAASVWLSTFQLGIQPRPSPIGTPPQPRTTIPPIAPSTPRPLSATPSIAANWQLHRRLTGHRGWVRSIAVSRNGKLLATGSYDRTLRLWDLGSGRLTANLSVHSGFVSGINSLAIAPNNRTIASGHLDKTIKLWDRTPPHPMQTLRGHGDAVLGVAFSPDGNRLASASADGTVRLWDWRTGRTLATIGQNGGVPLYAVAFSPDGRAIATGSRAGAVTLWDANSGQLLRQLPGHERLVRSVAFHPDGSILATSSADRSIRLWDVATGQQTAQLQGHTGPIASIAFRADGRILASGSSDKTLRLWDTANGREVGRLNVPAPIMAVQFDPIEDGPIAGGTDRVVRLWRDP